MYVETIFCENMGPIAKAVIKAGFTPEGNPKPIVLVGKNGSEATGSDMVTTVNYHSSGSL